MNILSKQYSGGFYWIAFALSLIATVLTSEQVVDLGVPWLGQVAYAATTLALLIQRLTPIGDSSE